MLPSTCRLVVRRATFTSNAFSAHISIPLGIIIGLLASSVQSLGLTIQRKSHVLNQSLPESQRRVEHRRPLWLLGFAIFISSNILGSLVQIASLPVVILAPLGAVSLLWNAFFARLILGDVFSPWMILGTVLIAGGAVLIAFFGIVPEPTRSLEDLLILFSRPAFIAYFSVLGVVVLVCLIATHITDYTFSRRITQLSAHRPSPSSGSYSAPATTAPPHPIHPIGTLSTGLTADVALSTEHTPLLDHKLTSKSSASSLVGKISDVNARSIDRTRVFLAVSYASFSGIISGMCLLFAKSGVELLLLTLRGQNQFWRWQAWVLVLGLVIFALLQLWYLHKALILADPTLVCPSAFCFYNLSSIMNGLVYFNQFSLISPLHLGLIVLGMLTLLGGVWVVSIQSGNKEVDVESWSDSDELEVDEGILDLQDDTSQSVMQSRTHTGPVTMERETRSESNIHDLTARYSLESDASNMVDMRRRQSGRLERLLSPERGSLGSTLLSPPNHLRNHQRRRTTVEYGGHTTSTSLHSHTGYTQLSPPLLPMNTLGAGFQIGLSPVSPGFAIVPRERGRRSSGLGFTASAAESNLSREQRQERRRRRTVSEGDIRGRGLTMPESQEEDVTDERGNEEDASENEAVVTGVTKGKGRAGQRRWDWLRRVIQRRQ